MLAQESISLIADQEPTAIREINPDIPEWLEAVVMKLLSKLPDERFESADEVSELLEGCLAYAQHPTKNELPLAAADLLPRQPEPPRWHKFIARAAFSMLVILAGYLVVLELNKGTLTIESDADVPIRILQGDEVVKQLTVSKRINLLDVHL